MLGKLMKYEWKSVYKMGSILLLAMFAVTVLGCMVFQMPWMRDLFADDSNVDEVQAIIFAFVMMVSFLVYIFMLMGVTYGIMIFLGVNFFKTMYTDQGYLTNTLPVKPHQLLNSKILVAGFWYLLIEIGVIVSVVALIFAFGGGIASAVDGYSFGEAMAMLWDEMAMALQSEFGDYMIHFGVVMLIMLLISPFTTMIILFSALTIGQLSKKHKALMGILTYFGLCMVTGIIASAVQMIYSIRLSINTFQNPEAISEMDMLGIYDYTLVINVVMAAVLYYVSHRILTQKLNLE